MEDVDTQRQFPLAQWEQPGSTVPLADLAVASEVASVEDSTVEEAEVDSEAAVDSKTEEATVGAEEVLATKEVVASHPEEAMVEVIAVGMEGPTGTELPQMHQLVQVAEVEEGMAEEALAVPALQIGMVLACQRQAVGMTRVVAVAHMMTDPADIVAVEAMTAMGLVEVAATWSR